MHQLAVSSPEWVKALNRFVMVAQHGCCERMRMLRLRVRDSLHVFATVFSVVALTRTSAAQSFPSRPLTLVEPFAAGGPSDVAGRIVAQGLTEKLGQQVVVEN